MYTFNLTDKLLIIICFSNDHVHVHVHLYIIINPFVHYNFTQLQTEFIEMWDELLKNLCDQAAGYSNQDSVSQLPSAEIKSSEVEPASIS